MQWPPRVTTPGPTRINLLLVPRQATFAPPGCAMGRPSVAWPHAHAARWRSIYRETARILEIVGALIADEAAWDRSPIRTDDPVNGRYTLYSALATACHQVTGRYSHRHPALEAVRAEIQDRVPGRRWKQRLAEFNAEASFEDVKAVLTSAIAANVA
jgi:hypothetical protein